MYVCEGGGGKGGSDGNMLGKDERDSLILYVHACVHEHTHTCTCNSISHHVAAPGCRKSSFCETVSTSNLVQ